MKIKMAVVSLAFCVAALAVSAQVVLPPVFADGMVLQQRSNAAIWGKAAPNAVVTVKASWDNKTLTTKAGKDSLWRVSVQTPVASFDPRKIVITSSGKSVELRDVIIGEVWLCGGQSNMEMPMNGFRSQPVDNSLEDIVNSGNDNLRIYSVKRNSTMRVLFDSHGEWVKASPNTTGRVSATGYYFGRMLQRALNVPVGLVVCCFGGSCIEAWMSNEILSAEFPNTYIPKSDTEITTSTSWPTSLYGGMLNSIHGYGIKGAIWYQGESNIHNPEEYVKLFEVMRKEWEKNWGIGQFPIYTCQIAPYDYSVRGGAPVNSAFLREAQLKVAQSQKNTAIVTLMDLGEKYGIHPARKKDVGERLAFLALNKSYGATELNAESPEYKSVTFDNGRAVLAFDKVKQGLFFKGDATGFELAGEDKIFHPATAKVVTLTSVIVESDKVAKPVAVRYCFKNFVVGSLFGGNGLPVSSFRSDDWSDVL